MEGAGGAETAGQGLWLEALPAESSKPIFSRYLTSLEKSYPHDHIKGRPVHWDVGNAFCKAAPAGSASLTDFGYDNPSKPRPQMRIVGRRLVRRIYWQAGIHDPVRIRNLCQYIEIRARRPVERRSPANRRGAPLTQGTFPREVGIKIPLGQRKDRVTRGGRTTGQRRRERRNPR